MHVQPQFRIDGEEAVVVSSGVSLGHWALVRLIPLGINAVQRPLAYVGT